MAKASTISLSTLQQAHLARQEELCPEQKPDLSFRGNELGGECGEAQNVIKKLERERHGWRGSRDTVEHLAEELADVIHCAVLCAITAGIDIETAVIDKFNATSKKNGLSTVIAAGHQPSVEQESANIEHDETKAAFTDTFDRLKAIIMDCAGVKVIARESVLVDDVGLDSLDTVEIVMAAEEHFGVEINDAEVAVVVTMQDAVNVVDKARAALAPESK